MYRLKVGDVMVCVTKRRYSVDPAPVITDMVVVKVGRLYFFSADAKHTDGQRKHHLIEFCIAHNGRYAYPEREGNYGSDSLRNVYPTREAYAEDLEAIELHGAICDKVRGNRFRRISLRSLKEIKAILDREEANV
jgi:hypothetical protein